MAVESWEHGESASSVIGIVTGTHGEGGADFVDADTLGEGGENKSSVVQDRVG